MDGSSTNYSYNNSPITIKIKDGKQYTVSFSDIEGYTTPQSVTYTAEAGLTRDLNLVYEEIVTGVRIVDLDGNLIRVENWTGGSNATGVALINDNVSIIIAPKNWYTYNSNNDGAWNGNKRSAWGGNNKNVTGIKTTTSTSGAITDFAGSTNTDAIISQLKGTTDNYSQYYTGAPAAEYCRAYSNGCKGAGQWYLPAAGEMNQIVLNKAAIEEALTAISGELFNSSGWDGYEWTSTQFSSVTAWMYSWPEEYLGNDYKYNYRGVRPITTIQNIDSYILWYTITDIYTGDIYYGSVPNGKTWYDIGWDCGYHIRKKGEDECRFGIFDVDTITNKEWGECAGINAKGVLTIHLDENCTIKVPKTDYPICGYNYYITSIRAGEPT